MFAFLSAPLTRLNSFACSLSQNQLCGIDHEGNGIYTTEGIIKLCEGIKGSAIISLKCATQTLKVFAFVSAPLDIHSSFTRACSLELNNLGPEGGAALAEGFKGNSTLTSLE